MKELLNKLEEKKEELKKELSILNKEVEKGNTTSSLLSKLGQIYGKIDILNDVILEVLKRL